MIAESSPFPWFSTARRSTRRLVVVAYWLVALGVFGLIQWKLAFHSNYPVPTWMELLFPLQVIVFLPALLGGVRAGGFVKPFRGVKWAPMQERDDTQTLFGPTRPVINSMTAADIHLDERERRQRDSVHFAAYTCARWFALGLLILEFGAAAAGPEWMMRAGNAAFYLLALVLWSLPQTLILWNEPDVTVPDMEPQQ